MQLLLNKKKCKEIKWTYVKPGGAAKSIGRGPQAAAIRLTASLLTEGDWPAVASADCFASALFQDVAEHCEQNEMIVDKMKPF